MDELFSLASKIVDNINQETNDMKSKLFPVLDELANESGNKDKFLKNTLPEILQSFAIYGVDSQNENVKKILARMKFNHNYIFNGREKWLEKAIEEYIERKKYL